MYINRLQDHALYKVGLTITNDIIFKSNYLDFFKKIKPTYLLPKKSPFSFIFIQSLLYSFWVN